MKYYSVCAVVCFLTGLLQAGELDFDAKLVEVKAPADAKVVTAEFKFSNSGTDAVSIRKHDASCSCMAVEISGGKLIYQPGETGTIRANFDMGNFSGSVDKSVLLWLDDDPQDKPSVVLTTRVAIPVLVAVEPKTLQWDLGSEGSAQVIRIKMNHDIPIHVKSVKCSSEAFSHELKTIKEGEEYEIRVTPKDLNAPGLAILRIETDCEIKRHKTQQAFAVVRRAVPGQVPNSSPSP